MVIDDQYIHALGCQEGDFVGRVCAAVESHKQVGFAFGDTALEYRMTESVAFSFTAGYYEPRGGSELGKHPIEQGRGGYAVDVVVAEDEDLFAMVEGPNKSVHGGFHARELEGVGEVGKSRPEKSGGFVGIAQIVPDEDAGDER